MKQLVDIKDNCCTEMFSGNGNSKVSLTYGLKWVGAGDDCASKNKYGPYYFTLKCFYMPSSYIVLLIPCNSILPSHTNRI